MKYFSSALIVAMLFASGDDSNTQVQAFKTAAAERQFAQESDSDSDSSDSSDDNEEIEIGAKVTVQSY